MLDAADAALASQDPGVPGLALVLDTEALAGRLAEALAEPPIRSVRPTYVRYKAGTSCLVGYRLETDAGPREGYAKALSRGDGGKLAKQVAKMDGVVLEDVLVAASVFPNDRSLPVLRRLGDPVARSRLLRRVAGGRPDLWEGTVTRLGYKPERRFVGRVDVEGRPVAVLKVYGPGGYRPASAAAKAFSSADPPPTQDRIGGASRHRVLALEWMPGAPLDRLVADPELDPRIPAWVGRALADLHGRHTKHLLPLVRTEEALIVLTTGRDVAALLPERGERARRLAVELARRLLDLPEMAVPVHGDFSPDQVLVDGDRVGILDLDGAALGDPTGDLGSLAAWMEVEAISGSLAAEPAARLSGGLLEGYGEQRAVPDPARLALYTAIGLLKVAMEPFRYRYPGWPELTERILARAEEVAG